MTMLSKTKVVLAKIETVYGTDPTPTNLLNAMLMTDVSFTPMAGTDVSRNLERPYLGAQAQIPAALTAMLEGSVEMAASGTLGTAPAWGALLRACGFSQTVNAGVSVIYAPVSSAFEGLTVYFYQGGTLQKVTGCRGTVAFTLSAQGIPSMRFKFTGLWQVATDQAAVVPTLTSFQKPLVASKVNTPVFTVNGVSLVARDFSLDVANQVEPRLLINQEQIMIVDRAPLLKATVEAETLATLNPFTLAQSQTSVAVALTHGTVAGNKVAISCPTCQMKRLPGYGNNQSVLEWPLELVPLPNAGNDEISVTLT